MRLRVVAADGRRFEHDVAGDEVVVGRSSKVGIPIADRAMSREHARFFRRGEGWYVEDLGSHNGTKVNDEAVRAPRLLATGDTVTVGESVLVVEVRGSAEGRTPSTEASVFRSAREMLLGSLAGATPPEEAATRAGRTAERLRILND